MNNKLFIFITAVFVLVLFGIMAALIYFFVLEETTEFVDENLVAGKDIAIDEYELIPSIDAYDDVNDCYTGNTSLPLIQAQEQDESNDALEYVQCCEGSSFVEDANDRLAYQGYCINDDEL